jgi:COMPASS component SWD1
MPVLLDIENSESEDEVVAIGAGQFRRKTPAKDWMNDGDSRQEVTPSGDERRVNGKAVPKRKRDL